MCFYCEGRGVLLYSERVLCVSIDCNNSARSWHLELEVCIMRYRIESSKCGSPEQRVITTAERDYIEDSLFASEVIRGSEDHFQCN